MVRTLILGLVSLALLGCEDAPELVPVEEDMVEYEGDVVVASGSRADSARSVDQPSSAEQRTELLAYYYDITLELPAVAVGDLMAQHRDSCQAVGSAICQVLDASLSGRDPEDPYAELQFRAVPDYVASFREGLTKDVEGAGGRIIQSSQSIENLTREILDTRARLEAQENLRDRLLTLLDRPTDDVGDLLQVERELARVQSEIESMTSQLAYLEKRVSMNEMYVSYQSEPKVYTRTKARPLQDALNDFFETLARSVADMIYVLAGALPWIVVGLPMLWGAVRLFKSWLR